MLYAVPMAIVRTPEGSARFDRPIGSALDDSPPEAPAAAASRGPVISSVRLRSLRAMIMAKLAVGDDAAAQALTEKFRAEYAEFSAGKSPQEIDQALNKAP